MDFFTQFLMQWWGKNHKNKIPLFFLVKAWLPHLNKRRTSWGFTYINIWFSLVAVLGKGMVIGIHGLHILSSNYWVKYPHTVDSQLFLPRGSLLPSMNSWRESYCYENKNLSANPISLPSSLLFPFLQNSLVEYYIMAINFIYSFCNMSLSWFHK